MRTYTTDELNALNAAGLLSLMEVPMAETKERYAHTQYQAIHATTQEIYLLTRVMYESLNKLNQANAAPSKTEGDS